MAKEPKSLGSFSRHGSTRRVVWFAFAVCATLIVIIVSDSKSNFASTDYNNDATGINRQTSLDDIALLRRADLDVLGLSSSSHFSLDSDIEYSASSNTLDSTNDNNDKNITTSELHSALRELSKCTTLNCITETHPKLKNSTKFNLPHFMIVGWQKAATTSVYYHLLRHPEILKPFVKEPHFFSSCQFGGPACRVPGGNNELAYIRDIFQIERAAASGLTLATLDASVDYAQREGLANTLHSLFPWLKVVFVVRERVGRAMSWKNMMQQKFGRGCSTAPGKCLISALRTTTYSQHMSEWFASFPAHQIHIMQFEELVEDPEGVLRKMKIFLGLDPDEPPAELRNVNARVGSTGWPVEKTVYQGLVNDMRADAKELMVLVKKYSLDVDVEAFMKRWEEVWKRNLDTCAGVDNSTDVKSSGGGSGGLCSISSS